MKVLEIRKQKPFIWWSEYLDIWKAFRWITSEKIHQITRLLVHSGEILTCGHPYTEQVSLVILDPEWFVRVLKSLNFVENMSRNSLETCWSSLGIGEKTWPQLEQLLQLFHLIIKLSNGEYLTISMIHATNESSLNNIERFYQRLPENSLCYGRSFKFSRLISGLADRLIIRILHYPGILIDKEICSKNDYFLYSNDFNVRVQVKSDENLLLVEVFSDLPSKASQLGFFVHYVFRSPESLLKSYPLHDARIISTQVFYSSKSEKIRGNSDVCLGKELDLIHQAIIQGKPLDQIPDIGLLCAPRLDCSTGRIERFLSGHSRFAWLATLTNQKVVLKELRYPSRIEQKEFLNEILMLCQIQSPFLINLIGICQISTSLLESCKESVACLDVEPMDNSGLLIALEFAPEGNLFDLHDKLRYSSMKMKLKIALDIARGLEIIHSCKLGIHRDVSSQNVFLFSLDELAVSDMNSIHAKLGDLGCVTIANPTYGEKFCNWQYMSPECFQPLAADYSSEVDVYAFGILLWEILTNLPPYHDQTNVQEVKLDILGGMRPKIPDTVPSAISQLIQSCWRKESNARPKFEQIVRILKSELYTYTYENFCARQQESYQRSISNYPQIDPAELFSGWQVLSKEEVLGKGCNGVVMKWEDGVCGPFAIKLLANYGVTTNQLSVVNRGEWALLEALPFHENIVKLLHRFRFRPPLDFLTNEHISHPSILDCVYHVNSFTNQRISNTCDFLVMEYLPGTLEDYLKVPQVNSVKRLLEICFDVAKGVKYLFDNRIVHRDLKLNNLLVSYAGVVVLCDFGSAIQLDNEQMVAILGPGGLPGGNWCHLAPEVRECKLEENQQKVISYKYQPSWELGILFLEIATLGEYPINSNEISPSDLHTFTQLTFPVEFCQLLNSCLSLVPTQRPNVDEICVLLQYLLYKTGQ
jgi:serine/threonine protein kinase